MKAKRVMMAVFASAAILSMSVNAMAGGSITNALDTNKVTASTVEKKIVGGKEEKKLEICPPCGICRQVMSEFCDPDSFQVILAKSEKEYETYLLKDLLPLSFGGELL